MKISRLKEIVTSAARTNIALSDINRVFLYE